VIIEDAKAAITSVLEYLSARSRKQRLLRQAEGVEKAKERGVHIGRKANDLPSAFLDAFSLLEKGELTVTEAAKMCGMNRSTFYYYSSKLKSEQTENEYARISANRSVKQVAAPQPSM
jgi:DNA invertase Pin-like site-specific DNA recombinase